MNMQSEDVLKTRATLLKKIKDWRDKTSWQEFFDTYWPLIYAAARRAGLADDECQDVVQETMVQIARRMPDFTYDPAVGSFRGWLRNQTRWCIVKQFRKRGRLAARGARTHTEQTPADLPDPATLISDHYWDKEWEKNLLEAAIARAKVKVDPLHYQIYDLYVNQECPAEKVAKIFGVKIAQLYLIKHRLSNIITQEGQRLEKLFRGRTTATH
jgi:RNA polymerase sigma-70 factor (ECF subfamily)